MNKENILEIDNLERSYSTVMPDGETKVYSVLRGISFQVKRGEFIGIMGSSGCGKTTLLKTIGMLNKPNGGKVLYNGEDTTEIYGDHLAEIRRTQLAFVFQDFYLMNSLRKYVERLINENFSDRDIWMTLTYDDAHLPPDGDVDAAIKNVQKYIRRINYQRKKRGLPNAKYVYVTAYNPDAEIRWHHHIVMDGALDMETVESCWKQSSRNEVRRLQTDENGLSGMANYIVEEKNRVPSEKRWNSSQGLRDPRIKVVHSKRPAAGGSYKKIGSFVDGMVKDRDSIPEILKKWYPDMDFTNANVYYNDFNCMFYIHARMRKRRLQSEKTEKTGKTCRTT